MSAAQQRAVDEDFARQSQGIDSVCILCWVIGGGTGAGLKAAAVVGIKIAAKDALEVGAKAAVKGTAKLVDEGIAKEETSNVAVIGRTFDTEVARGWKGHQVLNLRNWSLRSNDAWIKSVSDRGMDVYTASPRTYENLWDAVEGRERVFARELLQLTEDYGYRWEGDYLRSPSH